MKPLVLEMQAFGPFARKQVIDFRELEGKTFFLIHGPTGSGKTTILDGICFALFGDSSGGERDGRQMRSHHADADTLTDVRFDFALGPQHYRVRRVPEQMRKARRGSGETRQPQTAELLQLAVLEDGAAPRPIASGWNKVTERVIELLGFESRQFRQVIMLPQGKFFEFLKSSSQEREKILQMLFGTELYRRVEENLKQAALELSRRADGVRAKRQALLEQAQAENEAALEQRLRQESAALESLRSEERKADEAARKAEGTLAEARRIAAQFDELDKAAAALRTLSDQEQDWVVKRSRLAKARSAAAVDPYAFAVEELEEKLNGARTQGRELATALARAEEEQKSANAALEREQRRAPERDAAVARIAQLDQLKDKVAALARAQAAQAECQADARKKAAALDAARARQQAATAEQKRLAGEVQECRLAAAGFEGHRETVNRLRTQLKQANALAELREEHQRAAARIAPLQGLLEAAVRSCTTALAKRDEVRRNWVAGQATRLASELADGQPCPVCGALDHPSPAHAEGPRVQDADLESAEDALTRTQEAQRQAESKLAEQKSTVTALQARIEQILSSSGEASASPRELQEQLPGAESALQKAEKARTELSAFEDKLAAANRAAEKADAELSLATEADSRSRDKLQQAESVVAERKADIPDELSAPDALRAARDAAQKLRASLEDALTVATKAANQAANRLTEARALLQAKSNAIDELATELARKKGELAERIGSAGFADVDAYRAARLDTPEIASLESRIKEFDEALAAAKDRMARASSDTGDLARPDLAALGTVHESAKATHLALSNSVRDALAKVNATQGFVDSLNKIAAEFRELGDHYARVKLVSDVANGSNPLRMSFQRYVLATLLEEVLAATTLRLQVMSRGRYEMRRRRGPVDQRAAAGLDLEVFDHYTGTTRAVETLSGGESFLASLALALGLSDVVQSYAGGIRLDAIFVDEGFGTLDPESLDFAIRALKDLQEAGRMVGIISHVAELKEWIDARLELKATSRGSVAQFVH
jgi:exonuclease SbcC